MIPLAIPAHKNRDKLEAIYLLVATYVFYYEAKTILQATLSEVH